MVDGRIPTSARRRRRVTLEKWSGERASAACAEWRGMILGCQVASRDEIVARPTDRPGLDLRAGREEPRREMRRRKKKRT